MISFYLADNQKYDILKIGNNIWRAEPIFIFPFVNTYVKSFVGIYFLLVSHYLFPIIVGFCQK